MAADQVNRKRAAALMLFALLLEENESVPKKRNRKIYMRDWISRREEKGAFHQLVKELELEDPLAYRNFFRVTKSQFYFLVDKVSPLITKRDPPPPLNHLRPPIKPDERLAVTLRYLATGESFHSLEYNFRISRQTISSIVTETCDALYATLASDYFRTPNKKEEWEDIASKFAAKWNFPNGIGAIDGKRILIQQPANSGSHFYDYKGHNSIILLAVFGPDYECLWASVGSNGRSSDAAIWQNADIKVSLQSADNPLQLPSPRPLPGREKTVPYVLTGDDAFPLTRYLMKPYPHSGLSVEQRIFNYRLSRMRRISENGFGLLANRFRVFRNCILLPTQTVRSLVLAALVLHNFLRYLF